MVLNIFLILAGTGLLTLSYKSTRFQNVLSFLGIGVLGTSLYASYLGFHHSKTDSFSYSWLTSKFYPVNIDFNSNQMLYLLVMLFMSVAVLNMLFMLIRNREDYKLYIFSMIALGLSSLIMLNCSQNTIQLLISVSVIDVLGFCLIDKLNVRRRYIYYNLFADMILFMAFAMLWGDCRTNLISKLAQCRYQNHDWATWLMFLSVVIKSSLFPFQGILLPTTELSEDRQNVLSFTLTPITGIFLFYKIFPIISQNTTCINFMNVLIWLTFIWSIFGILFIQQLSKKKIYLNLMLYGLSLASLIENNGVFQAQLGLLFLLHICLNNSLKNTGHIFLMFVWSVLCVSSFILTANLLSPLLISSMYIAGILITISHTLRLPSTKQNDINSFFCFLLSGAVSVGVILYIKNISEDFYYWLGIYVALWVLNPYKWLQSVYGSPKIQTAQGFSGGIYFLIVQPIEFLGRILLLTIDFLIIEKTILGSLSRVNLILMNLFNKIHQPNVVNKIFFIIIGIGLIIYSCYGDR